MDQDLASRVEVEAHIVRVENSLDANKHHLKLTSTLRWVLSKELTPSEAQVRFLVCADYVITTYGLLDPQRSKNLYNKLVFREKLTPDEINEIIIDMSNETLALPVRTPLPTFRDRLVA